MRNAFVRALMRLAGEDDRVELITGDLGFGVFEDFARRYPDRYLNAGVAEQNMTGLAAGMALTGSVVFTYSIGNFPTLRCLEQIRSDVCYHDANVKIVAVGGGMAYGSLGVSHHATEDLAILRAIPRLMVAAPGDPLEASALTEVIAATPGPAYLRLGKTGEREVHHARPSLPPGTSIELRSGSDVAILATGTVLPVALDTADILLTTSGVRASVVSMPWIAPFDAEGVRQAGLSSELVVTLEEHSTIGGLGGATAEVLAEMGERSPLLRLGLPREFTAIVGTQEFLRKSYGLDPRVLAGRILTRLDARKFPALG